MGVRNDDSLWAKNENWRKKAKNCIHF